jgi:hypothetical protein
MDYFYRVHLLKNTDGFNGHAFIELGSPNGSTFYELNTNPGFIGTGLVKVLSNLKNDGGAFQPDPAHPELWDGKINRATTIGDLLTHLDGNKHVASAPVAISGFQFLDMQTYAEQRFSLNGSYTDYGLFSNSCLNFVIDVIKAGGIQTPLSSLFTSIDMLITGDTWVWYHGALISVPRPGAPGPTPLDAVTKFAAEVGFLPPDKTPVMSVAAGEIEQWLARPFDRSRADLDKIKTGIADGILPASIDFVSTTGNDRYTAPFDTTFANRFVFSGDQNGLTLSSVQNGFLAHITSYPTTGTRIDTSFDWNNTKPWLQQRTDRNTDGNITSVATSNDDGSKANLTVTGSGATKDVALEATKAGESTPSFAAHFTETGTTLALDSVTVGGTSLTASQRDFAERALMLTGVVAGALLLPGAANGGEAGGGGTAQVAITTWSVANGTVTINADLPAGAHETLTLGATSSGTITAGGTIIAFNPATLTSFGFDANGYLALAVANADGSTSRTQFDSNGSEAWSAMTTVLAANGTIVTQDALADDGTRTVYSADVANAANWAWSIERYDAAGRHVAGSGGYDGDPPASWTNAYDALNLQPWQQLTTGTAAGGGTAFTVTLADDNTRAIVHFDPEGRRAAAKTQRGDAKNLLDGKDAERLGRARTAKSAIVPLAQAA